MIRLIDNYDSFTYNLVQRLGEIDPTLDLEVHRNDQIAPEEIERRATVALDYFARPMHPGRGGRLHGVREAFFGENSPPGRLPGAPGDRAGLWRADRWPGG